MKTSYHVTPNGSKICEATIRDCQYGAHFDNLADANAHYEKTMRETFGEFAKVSKSFSQKRRENIYRSREKFLETIKAVKGSQAAQESVKAIKKLRSSAETVALASMYGAEATREGVARGAKAVISASESAVLGSLIARDAIKSFPRQARGFAAARGTQILRTASRKIEETNTQIEAKKQALAASASKERARMIGYVREVSTETKKRVREHRDNLKKLLQRELKEHNDRAEGNTKRRSSKEHRNLVNNERNVKSKLRSDYRRAIGETYGGKLKARFASDLRTGDYLANGLRVMQVSNVDDSTRITVMDPSSGISRTDIVHESAPVASVRPRRQVARSLKNRVAHSSARAWRSTAHALGEGRKRATMSALRVAAWGSLQGARGRNAWNETQNRVRVAATHQRSAIDALRGIDRAVIARTQDSAPASEINNVRTIHRLRKVA